MIITDLLGDILNWNLGSEKTLGYKVDEENVAIGRSIIAFAGSLKLYLTTEGIKRLSA